MLAIVFNCSIGSWPSLKGMIGCAAAANMVNGYAMQAAVIKKVFDNRFCMIGLFVS
jgi:hypothetical protein